MIKRKNAERLFKNQYQIKRDFERQRKMEFESFEFIKFWDFEADSSHLIMEVRFDMYHLNDDIGEMIKNVRKLETEFEKMSEVSLHEQSDVETKIQHTTKCTDKAEEISFIRHKIERQIYTRFVFPFIIYHDLQTEDLNPYSLEHELGIWGDAITFEIELSPKEKRELTNYLNRNYEFMIFFDDRESYYRISEADKKSFNFSKLDSYFEEEELGEVPWGMINQLRDVDAFEIADGENYHYIIRKKSNQKGKEADFLPKEQMN